MFNLEQSIAGWRKKMLAAGIKTPVPLEELESHLREEIGQLLKSGLSEQKAFEMSVQRIGQPEVLTMEFSKVDAENWNRPLAIAAWTTYVISFFLPSYGGSGGPFQMHLLGYQCAIVQGYFWSQAVHGDWICIHYELLTLSNALMLASPFCLRWMKKTPLSLRSFRYTTLSALILVWSFVLLLLLDEGGHKLEAGCYTWALSFLLLHVSAIPKRTEHVELHCKM